MPTSVVLNYEGGVYAIDPARCEKDDPDKSVLTWLVGCAFVLKGTQLNWFTGYFAGEVPDDASRRVSQVTS